MSNDLTVKPPNHMAQVKDSWGALAPTTGSPGLTIQCELGQPLSKKWKPKLFNFSNPEWAPQEKLTDLVIVDPRKTRVLYGAGFSSKRRCGSDNFATPSSKIAHPISQNCANCYAGKWDSELEEVELQAKRKLEVELQRKPNIAPTCNETHQLVVVDQRMIPFSLKFQKSSLKVLREQLINRIYYKGKQPFEVMFDLSFVDKTSYFEFAFQNVRDIPPEEIGKYQDIFKFFHSFGEQMMADYIDSLDQEKDVTGEEPQF